MRLMIALYYPGVHLSDGVCSNIKWETEFAAISSGNRVIPKVVQRIKGSRTIGKNIWFHAYMDGVCDTSTSPIPIQGNPSVAPVTMDERLRIHRFSQFGSFFCQSDHFYHAVEQTSECISFHNKYQLGGGEEYLMVFFFEGGDGIVFMDTPTGRKVLSACLFDMRKQLLGLCRPRTTLFRPLFRF